MKQTCSIEGCEKGGKITRGWCSIHYGRWYRHGDPEVVFKGGPRPSHGHSGLNRSPTYLSWCGMKMRCLNPNATGYDRWGGRGITVCDRWLDSFENFLADMGERPEGTSIDRIDPDGNYEPGNVRWATPKEQANNRRSKA